MKSLVKILSILPSSEYRSCVGLFFLMLAGAALEAVGIGAILPLISAMGDTNFLQEHETLARIAAQFGVYTHSAFILFFTVGLMAFYFLKNAFIGFSVHRQIRFVIRNQIFYSRRMMATYLFKPYLFHICQNTTSLLYNVNEGATVVFAAILLPLLGFMTECATSITIWIMLFMVDSFTAILVAVSLGGLVMFIIKYFRKRIGHQGEVQNACHVQYLTWANQGLGAIKEIKTMHTEDYFLQNFDLAYRRYGEARGIFDFLSQLPKLLIEVTVVSGLLILILLKIVIGDSPADIVPLLGLLALAAFRLMPGANRIVGYYNNIKFHMPFFHEIYPELRKIREGRNRERVKDICTEIQPFPFASDIFIDQLAFSYNGTQEILKNVTFRIAKGDFVGIIGASGAGKTTFVDILLGLLTPSKGRILVDGVDIFSDVRGWQENLAYVPQTIYLTDASIKENIAFGQDVNCIDATWMENVLHMAELFDFVQGLPDGLDTMVGERGVRLSGGQRQRIGIARALYRKPEVLVLDEATSSLDNETEKSIMNTVLKFKGKMTIIAIAHRISTLAECDYKVHFHDGWCEVE